MTHVFQVGDIVYVNELTPDIIEQRANHKHEFDDQINTLIGKHAVVMSTDIASSGIVGLVQCEPDYRFQIADAPHLDNKTYIETVPAQVTLVQGGFLRASRISSSASAPFGGVRLPFVGDTLLGPTSDEPTVVGQITIPYSIAGVSISSHHVVMETSTYGGRIRHVQFIPFKYFKNLPPFTTF